MLHDPEITIRFRDRLRELFERHNLSQRQLAKRCGFKSDRFRYYLTNGTPRATQLGAIAYGFGLTVQELLYGVVDEAMANELAALSPVAPATKPGQPSPKVQRAPAALRRETRPPIPPAAQEDAPSAQGEPAAPPAPEPPAKALSVALPPSETLPLSFVSAPSGVAIEDDGQQGGKVRLKVNLLVDRQTAANIVGMAFSARAIPAE